MYIVGEHPVYDSLSMTEMPIDYNRYHFVVKVNKSYSGQDPISYKFFFDDGSIVYYDHTHHIIQKIKDYGQAREFTLRDAEHIFERRLRKSMMVSSNGFMARGNWKDNDEYPR